MFDCSRKLVSTIPSDGALDLPLIAGEFLPSIQIRYQAWKQMPYDATVYKVMIASPSDVSEERQVIREVIQEWNAVHSEDKRMVLMPVGWETHSSPMMGERAQEIINREVLGDCDLLVATFWTRLGSPTGKAPSGTVEEIEEHLEAGKPAMVYFSVKLVDPDAIDEEQLKAVKEFRKTCQQKGLVEKYTSPEDLRAKFGLQLALRVLEEFVTDEVTPQLEDATATISILFDTELSDSFHQGTNSYDLYRIAIQSSQNVSGVNCVLEKTRPSSFTFLPVELIQMNDRPDPGFELTFTLYPEQLKFIDVVQKEIDSDEIEVCHVLGDTPRTIPAGKYRLEVGVRGPVEASRVFVIDVGEDGRLLFYPAEQESLREIGKLRQEIENLATEPRSLNRERQKRLLEKVSKYSEYSIEIYYTEYEDKEYAWEIDKVFRAAGWETRAAPYTGSSTLTAFRNVLFIIKEVDETLAHVIADIGQSIQESGQMSVDPTMEEKKIQLVILKKGDPNRVG